MQPSRNGQPLTPVELGPALAEVFRVVGPLYRHAARAVAEDEAIEQVSMVKLYTTEMCSRVYERCMQVHGGMGLTNEMKLYDGWHQARYVRIADGSAEIMRRNIARSILR